MPLEYERDFEKARLTFKHQWVYDPHSSSIVHLTPTNESTPPIEELNAFLGPAPESSAIAQAIARGDLDPTTRVPFREVSRSPRRRLSQSTIDIMSAKNSTLKYRPEEENCAPPPSPPITPQKQDGFVRLMNATNARKNKIVLPKKVSSHKRLGPLHGDETDTSKKSKFGAQQHHPSPNQSNLPEFTNASPFSKFIFRPKTKP